jgi:sigma-B regulation protein RsbU (phosphoserine phosphatase)
MKTFSDSPDNTRSQFHPNGLSDNPLDIEYAGVSHPASEVPGDFLETESLSTGEFIFAIGDTALLPDPLPVLCVRHYLHRGLSLDTTNPIVTAVRMNGLIYDCCEAKCSLTCFYAHYSRGSGVLRYVNAGHDAPVLIRINPDEVFRLERGGPVFGLQESPRYAEGFVHLKTGDRLVAFTHGIIDSLAAQNGGSAESVLISLARKNRNSSAAELASLIDAECEDPCSEIQVDRSVIVVSVNDVIPSTYFAAVMEAEGVLAEA